MTNQPPLLPLWRLYASPNPGKAWVINQNGDKVSPLLSSTAASRLMKAHNIAVELEASQPADAARTLSEILQYNDMSDALWERLKLLLHSLEASQPCVSEKNVKTVEASKTGNLEHQPKPQQSDEGLREALTPSAETKAAYSGEFHFNTVSVDDNGDDLVVERTVPWTTVKEIMAAILNRAALSRQAPVPTTKGGKTDE